MFATCQRNGTKSQTYHVPDPVMNYFIALTFPPFL